MWNRRGMGCINRNIVECKEDYSSIYMELGQVLIETLWNVKGLVKEIMEPATGINRNIVECKAVSLVSLFLRSLRINRNIVECKVFHLLNASFSGLLY